MDKKDLHIAIGHYGIGSYDGVNTVIWRTVTELQKINPDLSITLFGKTTDGIKHFLPWKTGKLTYRNIEEMSPDYRIPGLEDKSIKTQRVHDYIWHGTNVAERLQQQFAECDIVMMENLSVGVNPAIIYAFYLWSLWEFQAKSNKRFFVRVHDFAQQRPANFSNIKKFQAYLPTDMPDWHQILYPSTPNVEYIPINTTDYYRLLEHGADAKKVWYIPNTIDNSLIKLGGDSEFVTSKDKEEQKRQHPLRQLLNEKKNIDPDAAIIYYPVRAIPRKNIEEAIFLNHLLNNLAKQPEHREKYELDEKYHLVVSLGGGSPEEKDYTQQLKNFVEENNLPVTIDISEFVGLHREYDPDDPQDIVKYGVSDMYDTARMTVSTSLLEGFGFVFIEPWVTGQCVIGRNIPSVTMDFVKAGLSLDHLYNVLLVNGCDFADIGKDQDDHGLALRLHEILKLNDESYLHKILNRNSASLRATLKLFRYDRRVNPKRNLVVQNRKKVLEHYSSKAVVAQLYRIFTSEEPAYINPVHAVTPLDNGHD